MLLTYFLIDFEMVPVAPIITGITFVFTLHMCLLLLLLLLLVVVVVVVVVFCRCNWPYGCCAGK